MSILTKKPYVSKVVSNLKSPCDSAWSTTLTEKTLIVGDNGSGKTAIVQALELALTGAADDIVGRSGVKDVGTLKGLAPGEPLSSEVILSNGQMASFSLDGKKRHMSAYEDALVLRDVKAALLAGPAKAREALLHWLSDDIDQSAILGALSADDAKAMMEIGQHKKGAPAVVLARVIDHLNSQGRKLNAEIKGAKKIIEQMSGELTSRPLDEDIEAAETAAAEAQKKLNESKAAHAHALLAVSRDAAETWCPVCSSEVGADHLGKVFRFWEAQLGSENILASDVVEAHKHLTEIRAAAQAWDRMTNSRRAIREMEQSVEKGKRLKAVLSEVSTRLLDTALGRFVVEVQERLPSGWTFGINASGTVRVGLRSLDGTLRPSLSGAEWAAVTAAIGSVVAERRAVEMPILILEDRAWDETTLASVMTSLRSFSGQVIITTTRGPSAPVAGWSVVSVDLDQQGPTSRIMRRLTETGYTETNADRAQLQSLSRQ
tara:strand:- start:534 stop:2000 length:1467 start_codon:yes stop_codon:yes gene_type:complete